MEANKRYQLSPFKIEFQEICLLRLGYIWNRIGMEGKYFQKCILYNVIIIMNDSEVKSANTITCPIK